MGVTSYLTIDGEILSETRSGVESDYVPDSLGSTFALISSTQNLTDTWTYWPYGQVASRTGTTATPMQFVGTFGYHQDSVGRVFVSVRSIREDLGCWTSVDPVWPAQLSYVYGLGNPTTFVDPTGTKPKHSGLEGRMRGCLERAILKFCGGINLSFHDLYYVFDCIIEGESGWKGSPTYIKEGPQAGGYALGLMQIAPELGHRCTAWGYADWATDPCSNIECGVRNLCNYMRLSQSRLIVQGDPRSKVQGVGPRGSDTPPWIHGPLCRGQENAIYLPPGRFDLCLENKGGLKID